MRALAMIALLVSCGPPAQPPVEAPASTSDAPGPTDDATLYALEAEIVGAESTRCVQEWLAAYDLALAEVIAPGARTVVMRLGYAAQIAHYGGEDPTVGTLYRRLAHRLAFKGDLDSARWALARAKPARIEADPWSSQESAILLGEPPGDALTLELVQALALAGHHDLAAETFAAADHPPAPTGDPELDRESHSDHATFVGIALAALGRIDELEARIAAGPPAVAAALAGGWIRHAVRDGEALDRAVAAILAHRTEHHYFASGRVDLGLLYLVDVAASLGRGRALAPVFETIRSAPANPDVPGLARIYEVALRVADDAELAALEASIAASKDAALQARQPLLRVAARGTLDELLAAFDAIDEADLDRDGAALLAHAWARHVATGFTPEGERALTDVACVAP